MLKTLLDLFNSSESTEKMMPNNNESNKDAKDTTLNGNGTVSVFSPQIKSKIDRGIELENQGQIDLAIAVYYQAVDLEPESGIAHLMLAKALKKQNKISAAAFHYARAAKLDTNNYAIAGRDVRELPAEREHQDLIERDNNLSQSPTDFPKTQTTVSIPLESALSLKSQTDKNNIVKQVSNQKTMIQDREDDFISQQKTELQSDGLETKEIDKRLEQHQNLAIKNWQQKYSASLATQDKKEETPQSSNLVHQERGNASSLTIKNDNGAIVLPTLKTKPSRTKLDLGKLEVAQIYLKQALAYGEEKQWEQAIKSCQTALEIAPDCAEAYKIWGNILQKMNRIAEAIGYYAKAIAIQPDMAEAYANLGSLYAKQQKWHEAVEYYQKSLMLDPNCAGVYRNLAKIWEEFGEEEKALDCLFQALEIEPKTLNAEQHFQLAEELATEGDVDKAIACYRYAIALDVNFREAYLKLAKALEAKGEWREAGIYYQEIIRIQGEQETGSERGKRRYRVSQLLNSSSKIQPKKPLKQLPGQRGIDRKLLQGSTSPQEIRDSVRQQRQTALSETDLAIQQYLKKAKVEPNSSIVQINLGSLYARKQNWQQASLHYKRAIELDPNSAIGYRNLAKVYGKIGESDKAANLLFQAYGLESSNISATEHWQLGEVLRQQNQMAKATSCYRRAIKCQPSFTNAYLSLGNILAGQNNQQGAVSCYKQAIKYSPADYRAYFLLGQIYDRSEQWQQSISCYQQTIKLKPDNAEALHRLGDALAKQEKWESAIAAYQRAIALNPDFSWSHNNLGDAWLQLNNWQAAAESLQKAIALNPNFAWSHYKLGDALVLLKQWNRAVKAYNRARELQFDLPDIEAKLANAVACQMGLDSRQSMSYYQDAIEQNPDNLQLYYKALEADRDNGELYVKLADALERQNYPSEAIGFYKIALQMQVARPEIIEQIERVKLSM